MPRRDCPRDDRPTNGATWHVYAVSVQVQCQSLPAVDRGYDVALMSESSMVSMLTAALKQCRGAYSYGKHAIRNVHHEIFEYRRRVLERQIWAASASRAPRAT
jgi:hypothetical protein